MHQIIELNRAGAHNDQTSILFKSQSFSVHVPYTGKNNQRL